MCILTSLFVNGWSPVVGEGTYKPNSELFCDLYAIECFEFITHFLKLIDIFNGLQSQPKKKQFINQQTHVHLSSLAVALSFTCSLFRFTCAAYNVCHSPNKFLFYYYYYYYGNIVIVVVTLAVFIFELRNVWNYFAKMLATNCANSIEIQKYSVPINKLSDSRNVNGSSRMNWRRYQCLVKQQKYTRIFVCNNQVCESPH